ncbi:HBL/NHE enterotoxin family protein [Aquimarina sp. 2201CG1-2-11]|uniref:HBL/NHE enterotoxin family protein n=1 Tax=Aquimarina discodermiae TaxID=3231043 RepID=UPI0034624086
MIITKNEVTTTNTAINPPSQLISSVPRTVSAITAITNGVKQLEQLPATSSSITPSLGSHIQAAKANGNTWTKTLRPSLVTILNGISDFSSTFDAEYSALLAAAKKIGTDDTEAIAEFKTELTKLQTVSKKTAGEASAAQSAISAFDNNVNTDSRNFRSDQQQANAAHASAVQNVQNAQRRIRSLEEERAKKQEILNSLGIFSPLAKAIEELIEALSGQIGAQQREMEQAQHIAQQAYMDLQATQQALGATQTYLSTAGVISSEVNALMDGWETLDSNFNVLLASEKITSFNVFTQDVLAAVKADWENLAKQATSL